MADRVVAAVPSGVGAVNALARGGEAVAIGRAAVALVRLADGDRADGARSVLAAAGGGVEEADAAVLSKAVGEAVDAEGVAGFAAKGASGGVAGGACAEVAGAANGWWAAARRRYVAGRPFVHHADVGARGPRASVRAMRQR